jgi:hypothetical protein
VPPDPLPDEVKVGPLPDLGLTLGVNRVRVHHPGTQILMCHNGIRSAETLGWGWLPPRAARHASVEGSAAALDGARILLRHSGTHMQRPRRSATSSIDYAVPEAL